jgi:hypothetical protein
LPCAVSVATAASSQREDQQPGKVATPSSHEEDNPTEIPTDIFRGNSPEYLNMHQTKRSPLPTLGGGALPSESEIPPNT